MTTITVDKTELKHAFTGDYYHYTQENSEDSEHGIDLEAILLRIMLDNSDPINNQKEAG